MAWRRSVSDHPSQRAVEEWFETTNHDLESDNTGDISWVPLAGRHRMQAAQSFHSFG